MRIHLENRWRNHATQLYFHFTQSHLIYHVNEHLTIAPGFRQVKRRLVSKWIFVEQPMFDIAHFYSWKGWNVIDRHRFQYNYPLESTLPERIFYRNLIRITTPWKWTRYEVTPYFQDEIFWKIGGAIVQNRIRIGLEFRLPACLTGRIFYLFRRIPRQYQSAVGFHLVIRG